MPAVSPGFHKAGIQTGMTVQTKLGIPGNFSGPGLGRTDNYTKTQNRGHNEQGFRNISYS
jgi:hypothetical protein